MSSHARRRLTPDPRRVVLLCCTVVTLATVPAVAATSSAAPRDATADTAKGTRLVERFFDLLTDSDLGGLAKLLSPAFQLQGADGGFLDGEDFIVNPPEIESYELSELRATRAGNVMVVRYDVQAEVTIEGVPQSRDPAPRLSVFAKGKSGWQLVAHANFNVPA
jgi:hypothetical protein